MLAEKIMNLRKQRGWSQEDLAARLDVSRQSVSKWESAASVPDLDKIIKLSEIFGVTTDYLLKDEKTENSSYEAEPEVMLCEGLRQTHTEENPVRELARDEIYTYINLVGAASNKIAAGASACIFSPVVLMILMGLTASGKTDISENSAAAGGVVVLLLIIAVSVGVFITWGLKLERFEYIEKEPVRMPVGETEAVKRMRDDFAPAHKKCITVGVTLCILCAVPLFVAIMFDAPGSIYIYCVALLLTIVAAGVFLIVRVAMINGAYQKLLNEGEYTFEKKMENKRNDNLSKVYWCTITAVYLGISFLTGKWHITWVIWPCAGVFFAAVCGIAAMVRKR